LKTQGFPIGRFQGSWMHTFWFKIHSGGLPSILQEVADLKKYSRPNFPLHQLTPLQSLLSLNGVRLFWSRLESRTRAWEKERERPTAGLACRYSRDITSVLMFDYYVSKLFLSLWWAVTQLNEDDFIWCSSVATLDGGRKGLLMMSYSSCLAGMSASASGGEEAGGNGIWSARESSKAERGTKRPPPVEEEKEGEEGKEEQQTDKGGNESDSE
jgi:hypothetical protein